MSSKFFSNKQDRITKAKTGGDKASSQKINNKKSSGGTKKAGRGR